MLEFACSQYRASAYTIAPRLHAVVASQIGGAATAVICYFFLNQFVGADGLTSLLPGIYLNLFECICIGCFSLIVHPDGPRAAVNLFFNPLHLRQPTSTLELSDVFLAADPLCVCLCVLVCDLLLCGLLCWPCEHFVLNAPHAHFVLNAPHASYVPF